MMLNRCLKTKRELNGYKYSNTMGGKRWVRGRTMFSEGRQWVSNNQYVNLITKTNLDTREISIATMNEAKRFLTEEGYSEYVKDECVKKVMEGDF